MSNAVEHRFVRHRARPAAPAASVGVPEAATSTVSSAIVDEASYGVGYAKPPVEHRFKPGKSGNPRGRPKGAKGVNATIRHAMEQKVVVRSGGKTKKVTSIEALILKLRERALHGDARAIDKLLALYRMAAPDEAAVSIDHAEEDLSQADDAILSRFRSSILAEAAHVEAVGVGDVPLTGDAS